MSVRVQTFVWQLELQPSHKLVAIALADHCHDDGSEARPSQATLAAKTGLSDRQVRRILKDLVELGVIAVQRPPGQHRATCYQFKLPADFGTIRPDTMSALRTARPDIGAARPDICDSQTGHPCPTNHKEPLLEPLKNLEEIKKRNREILRGMR